jgi:hypothetical protein
MTIERRELILAVDHALAGEWEPAHAIVQRDESDQTACWIHAVLHKLEPDESNSRYWYRRAGKAYEAYADGRQELIAIKAALTY